MADEVEVYEFRKSNYPEIKFLLKQYKKKTTIR